MDVFALRDHLIGDYSRFARSFTVIRASDLKAGIDDAYGSGRFWPDPLELDACYARLYGLTRDELRYILDPADVMGEDYPSETFRVLKNNEVREFGEYRTQRLVLEAWDKLQSGELH